MAQHQVTGKTDTDYILAVTCVVCGQQKTFHVPHQQYFNWNSKGELIQNAMPAVSADNRELLITGICGACFDKMFSEED